jgi:hypothetical protein
MTPFGQPIMSNIIEGIEHQLRVQCRGKRPAGNAAIPGTFISVVQRNPVTD